MVRVVLPLEREGRGLRQRQYLRGVGGTVVYSCIVQAPEYPKSILRFQWMYENETNTYSVGDINYIDMLVEGSEKPRVYSDRPDIVFLYSEGYTGGETGGRISGSRIRAKMLAPGTANIICEYEGGIATCSRWWFSPRPDMALQRP